jgi:hypothetical protein
MAHRAIPVLRPGLLTHPSDNPAHHPPTALKLGPTLYLKIFVAHLNMPPIKPESRLILHHKQTV